MTEDEALKYATKLGKLVILLDYTLQALENVSTKHNDKMGLAKHAIFKTEACRLVSED